MFDDWWTENRQGMRDTCTYIADKVILHKKYQEVSKCFFQKNPDVSGVWPLFSVRKTVEQYYAIAIDIKLIEALVAAI